MCEIVLLCKWEAAAEVMLSVWGPMLCYGFGFFSPQRDGMWCYARCTIGTRLNRIQLSRNGLWGRVGGDTRSRYGILSQQLHAMPFVARATNLTPIGHFNPRPIENRASDAFLLFLPISLSPSF